MTGVNPRFRHGGINERMVIMKIGFNVGGCYNAIEVTEENGKRYVENYLDDDPVKVAYSGPIPENDVQAKSLYYIVFDPESMFAPISNEFGFKRI